MRKKRRAIAQIANDLAAALKRETTDIIAIGDLLIEAQDGLDHGQWLPWLKINFGSSDQTAERYMSAARLAAKFPTVGNLKLRPTALYLLGIHLDDGPDYLFSPKAIEAVLKAAETEWVTEKRAHAIAESLIPTPEVDDEEQERREAYEHRRREADERRRVAEDILDNPPSDLPPPPEPAPPANVSLTQFDKAITMLAQIYTKSIASFAGTKYSPDQIRSLGDFLVAVAEEIVKRRAA